MQRNAQHDRYRHCQNIYETGPVTSLTATITNGQVIIIGVSDLPLYVEFSSSPGYSVADMNTGTYRGLGSIGTNLAANQVATATIGGGAGQLTNYGSSQVFIGSTRRYCRC